MAKVILYGAPWCQWCLRAKMFFENHNIPFEWKDVDIEENAEEVLRKSKQYSIPVIDIDGQIIVGFDVERVKSLLKIKE
ncbi:MAG: glutaredoxin domain-containing protein [Candidatus Bilamarchaeaceae archaeon]